MIGTYLDNEKAPFSNKKTDNDSNAIPTKMKEKDNRKALLKVVIEIFTNQMEVLKKKSKDIEETSVIILSPDLFWPADVFSSQ